MFDEHAFGLSTIETPAASELDSEMRDVPK